MLEGCDILISTEFDVMIVSKALQAYYMQIATEHPGLHVIKIQTKVKEPLCLTAIGPRAEL